MEIPAAVILAGALGAIVIVILIIALIVRGRRVNLTGAGSTGKPAWRATTPPAESLAATKGAGIYGQEAGERVAAPFAEQIEDIVRARIRADLTLADTKFDMGSAPDGSLEIWVDGALYKAVQDIPNPHLRIIVKEAIEKVG